MGDNAKSKKFKTVGHIRSPNIRACKCHKSQTTLKFHQIINKLRETASTMAPLSAKNVHTSNTKIFQNKVQSVMQNAMQCRRCYRFRL